MAIDTTSTPTLPSARRFGRNALLATIGGTIVLAATVTGVVMVRSENREPVSTPVAASAVQPSFTNAVASARGYAAPATVYIVGSAEQAATIRADLNEAADIRVAAGETLLPDTESVVVAASDDDAASVVQGINEANGIRANAGLAAYAVMDLRGK